VHHGVEINLRLVDLSRAKLGQLGLYQVEVFHHSCFGLDFAGSMRCAFASRPLTTAHRV